MELNLPNLISAARWNIIFFCRLIFRGSSAHFVWYLRVSLWVRPLEKRCKHVSCTSKGGFYPSKPRFWHQQESESYRNSCLKKLFYPGSCPHITPKTKGWSGPTAFAALRELKRGTLFVESIFKSVLKRNVISATELSCLTRDTQPGRRQCLHWFSQKLIIRANHLLFCTRLYQ